MLPVRKRFKQIADIALVCSLSALIIGALITPFLSLGFGITLLILGSWVGVVAGYYSWKNFKYLWKKNQHRTQTFSYEDWLNSSDSTNTINKGLDIQPGIVFTETRSNLPFLNPRISRIGFFFEYTKSIFHSLTHCDNFTAPQEHVKNKRD